MPATDLGVVFSSPAASVMPPSSVGAVYDAPPGADAERGATSALTARRGEPSAQDASTASTGNAPLDDTAESVPDTAATLAQEFARRAEVVMLVQQSEQQVMQAKLDRMKADFNAAQEERTEQLREMNTLRDMALAQAKQDDEVLKKYIALI